MPSMSLRPGQRLAHYEILASIGAGGMGEVYRARDTKLGRDVAIKVLPEEFSKDRERSERFEREARLLAQLNHANVATLHGLEDSDGQKFLVMELVEGETLAEAIARGPIPVDEALPLFMEIAEGVEAAHEKGIIHRDLKPANIKIGPDGKPKILDFGLAKAFAAEQDVPAGTSQSPTLTKGTALGAIMGTASYMSPEQARGKLVDKRTDIWAFGCCLFEALTGSKPFTGDNVTDILAAVVRAEPDWNALPETTPPHLRQLLRRCLTKDPRQRVRDIGDARIALQSPGEPASMVPSSRRRAIGILWAGLAIVSAALAAVLVSLTMETADEDQAITFPISSTPSLQLVTGFTTPFAISHDGRTIAFMAVEPPATVRRLWVRSLHDHSPRVLEGTDGGMQPAFSPDGEWIAFVADNFIKKVSVNGGPVTTLATLEYYSAAITWLSADEILAEALGAAGIQILSAHGGTPEKLIPLDMEAGEFRQRRPFVLRDRRMVLYASTVRTGRTELVMFSLDDGRRARLDIDGVQALGIVDERLVYVREDGVLMTVPFDAARMQTTGTPLQLLEQVASYTTGVSAALSANGTLVTELPRNRDAHLTLLDASGQPTLESSDVRSFREPRFSPDGTRIAVEVGTGTGFDVWIYDEAFTSPQRVTRSGNTMGHRWTPDGQSLIYSAPYGDGTMGLWRVAADGSALPTRLERAGDWVVEAEITPDGQSLVLRRRRLELRAENLFEIVLVPLEGDADPIALVTGESRPRSFRLSPDGRLLAYVDLRPELRRVMVMSLDGEDEVFVSEGGQVVWARDSRSLFYRSESGEQLRKAELTTSPKLEVVRQSTMADDIGDVLVSDVTPDGLGFLALTPLERGGVNTPETNLRTGSEILVSVNWAAEKIREWQSR